MNFLEQLIYGFVSGITEILPVSSLGHQELMNVLFGVQGRASLQNMFIHIACLVAVIVCNFSYLSRLYKEKLILERGRKSRKKVAAPLSTYDVRLLKTAIIPLVLGMLFHIFVRRLQITVILMFLFWLINGIVLLIEDHISHGNKDSRKMTGLDGAFLGLISAISVVPGISRTGLGLTFSSARGADRKKAFSWVLTLSIPALVLWIVFDIVDMFIYGAGISSFVGFLGCLLSAGFSFIGAYGAILLLRYLSQKTGYGIFAYYSFGASILCLLLYLTV